MSSGMRSPRRIALCTKLSIPEWLKLRLRYVKGISSWLVPVRPLLLML